MKRLKDIISEDWDNSDNDLINHYSKFSNKHKKALNNFTENSFDINDHLWRRHEGSTYIDKNAAKKIPLLDEAINLHSTPKNLEVYSGIGYDPRYRKNKEGIVHHPAFLSTSLHKKVAEDFAQIHQEEGENGSKNHWHLLKINIPKGSHGAYIDHISQLGGQKEFVLPRGSNMKYLKHTTENRTKENGYPTTMHIHHMEVV